MIALLSGKLVEKHIDRVIVDVGGVGFEVFVSLHTLAVLGEVGREAKLLTSLQVREDALTLYGFASAEERATFDLCMSVQGVGPKLAMSILSTLTPDELARAVADHDTARLRRIPGVGNKTAERLTLELRDKLDRIGGGRRAAPAVRAAAGPSGPEPQVISALVNLGYKPAEAERAAKLVVAEAPEAGVAELVKQALRALAE